MNREIKFDAIYKPTGEHITPLSLDFNDNTITFNLGTRDNDWCHFSLDGKRGDVILRQYTGLINIQNKEIYEGDILKDDENFNWIVKFKQGSFVAECSDLMAEQSLNTINLYCTVIGNIYENPELLEQP